MCVQKSRLGRCGAIESKGESFAKAYISTAASSPLEDPRVPYTHEDEGRAQSACGTP